MTYSAITYEQFDTVVRVSQNRPQQRNAQNQQLLEELDDAMTKADADSNIRVIILAGTGDHFTAGHDLKEAGEKRADYSVEQRYEFEVKHYFDTALRIRNVGKPVIAQVQGACIAAGFMVANMCDLIIAAENAYFSDPTGHSLSAASVEVLIHPWVMGARRAKEMLFTGEKVSAEEAYRIGMVNRVVPLAELAAKTLEFAQKIAAAPPFGLRLIKRSINRTLDIQGMASALSAHFDTHELSHMSAEFQQIRATGLAKAIQAGKKLG
jgi:enoyl-CoA hydratase